MQVLVYDIAGIPENIVPKSSRLILHFQQISSMPTKATGQIHVICPANKSCIRCSRLDCSKNSLVRTRAIATSIKKSAIDPNAGTDDVKLEPKRLRMLLGSQYCMTPYAIVKISVQTGDSTSICNHMTCKFDFLVKGDNLVRCHVVLPISSNPLNNISFRYPSSQDDPACYHGTWTMTNNAEREYAAQTSAYATRRLRRKVAIEKSFRLVSAAPVLKLKAGIYRFNGWASREGDYLLAMVDQDPTSRPHQRLDECVGSVELLRNGTLKGFSCESCNPQICAIRGTWKPRRVQFELNYHVIGEVGKFIYDGRVHTDPTTMTINLGGCWRNIDDQENLQHAGYRGGRGHFAWNMMSSVCIDRLNDKCCSFPFIPQLTPGKFTLRGHATDSDGYEYPEILTLRLYPGGKLHGSCSQLLFSDQECKVTGKWTARSLKYRLRFSLHNKVGSYRYVLHFASDGMGIILQGKWWNISNGEQLQIGEQGTSSFAILKAMRHWDQCCNDVFPNSFRNVSSWLLSPSNLGCYRSAWPSNRYYQSSNASKLPRPPMIFIPPNVWQYVLSFCHEGWF